MSQKKAKEERQVRRRADTELVTNYLLKALIKLRTEFARRLKIQRRKFPKMKLPCETCAFRASADFSDGDDGFIRTSLRLVHAFAVGADFYCHEPKHGVDEEYKPRWNKKGGYFEHCAGWMVMQSTMPEPLDIRALLGPATVETISNMARTVDPRLEEPRPVT